VTDWSKVDHHTGVDDIVVFDWVRLNATTEVTRVPLWDRRHDLFARLTYREAAEFAASIDARLVSSDELEELRQIAIVIEPVTLAATKAMSSVEWSRRHDQEALRRLSLVDDFKSPILGAGKHFISGAPEGRAYLKGWWTEHLSKYSRTRRGPGWIQEGAPPGSPGPHSADGVRDYGTTTVLVRSLAA
jgi:hypothetical protein